MISTLLSEFKSLSLGDKRLNGRALKIATRLSEKPTASFPKIFPSSAELEAFYRFVESPYIQADALLNPHISATVQRVSNAQDSIIIHDTTEFTFSGSRQDLAPSSAYKSSGFFGHVSLAVGMDAKPLGVLRIKTWTRNGPTRSSLRKEGARKSKIEAIPSEQERWFEGIRETAVLCENSNNLLHVCDSEGDDYALFSRLQIESHRFVIRACQNRCVDGTKEKLFEILPQKPLLAERTVPLSKREPKNTKKRNPARDSRTANLEIRCARIDIKKPKNAHADLPNAISLNVVYVSEPNPPDAAIGVEWLLLTTEPISTAEEVLKIVDIYRTRWLIEEYFKVLKSGCSYESRQLDSYHTLLNCLSLFIPVAWLNLSLRYLGRKTPELPADQVLPLPMLEVLRLKIKKPIETVGEAYLAIAGLGGHIKNNGPPGLLVLWQGFHELAVLTKGYLLAIELHSNLSMKRCDQS